MKAYFLGTTDGKNGWVMYHIWERRGNEIWFKAINHEIWWIWK